MASALPEFFLRDQSFNGSCGGMLGCATLSELGPPPNLILTIPPPPLPPFMDNFVSRLPTETVNTYREGAYNFPEEGKECNLCHWSDGGRVGFVELTQKGPLIDDTWFLIIISTCIGTTLLGIILAIGFFKYRAGKLKPLSDVVLAKKEKALGLERCEAVLYPTSQVQASDGRSSRALWAGVKALDGNHYTVDHCQPMDQKPGRLDLVPSSDNNYDFTNYNSNINYSTIGPLYGTNPQKMISPLAGRPVHSTSFENIGFVSGDEPTKTERLDSTKYAVARAAYLLGNKNSKNSKNLHLYEMVAPRLSVPSRKQKSFDQGTLRHTPIISAPTSVPDIRLPPLNCRYNGRYTLKDFSNGSQFGHKMDTPPRLDIKYTTVALDRAGAPNTSVASFSPTDNIYASPITSPVF